MAGLGKGVRTKKRSMKRARWWGSGRLKGGMDKVRKRQLGCGKRESRPIAKRLAVSVYGLTFHSTQSLALHTRPYAQQGYGLRSNRGLAQLYDPG